MAIELISRPIGHKLGTSDIEAQIIDDGTGDVLVYTGTGHGLTDGDYVFIDSDFDRYNGYFLVDSIAYDSFKIKTGTEYVEFIQDANIVYRVSVIDHGFQCVHLPIVYELKSNLWPNNIAEETYTPVTIASQENVNGYTKLNLSTAISGLTDLNFIELIGGSLSGAYQIIDVVQPWSIVINLSYSASNSFIGVQVVNYYNNYAINVNVYAGYGVGNRWQSIKPYEIAATLKLIPNSTGKVKFSIAEILKGYINTRNNLTLDTLPNNTDFSVGFYIEYFETYDESNGTDIDTFTGDVTTDTFEGHAVNAMLPFKSIDSGFMSEYVDGGDYLAQWLTMFDRPLAIVGMFFDISFINQYDGADVLVFRNGELFQTITNPGAGVIRVMFIPEIGFSEYCLRAALADHIEQRLVGGDVFDMSTFQNGPGNAWTLGANPSYSNSDGSALLYVSYPVLNGNNITINYNVDVQFMSGNFNLVFTLTNSSSAIQDSQTIPISNVGQKMGSVVLTATSNRSLFAVFLSGPGVAKTLVIEELSEGVPTLVDVVIPGFDLTETICIDVIDECSPTYINDNLRLTEGGNFRELE